MADYSTFDTDGYRGYSKSELKQFDAKLSFEPNEVNRANLVFNRFDMRLGATRE